MHSEAGCTIVSVELLDEKFRVGCVYAPVDPQRRIAFFNDLRRESGLVNEVNLVHEVIAECLLNDDKVSMNCR